MLLRAGWHANDPSQGVDPRTGGAAARLARSFPELHMIEKTGRAQGLQIEDILDATVACWSAFRMVSGKGRSLPNIVPFDITGLPMAIWV